MRDAGEAVHRTVQLVADSVPRALGVPADDTQVITAGPRRRGGHARAERRPEGAAQPRPRPVRRLRPGRPRGLLARPRPYGARHGRLGRRGGAAPGLRGQRAVVVPQERVERTVRHGWALTAHQAAGMRWPAAVVVLPGDAARRADPAVGLHGVRPRRAASVRGARRRTRRCRARSPRCPPRTDHAAAHAADPGGPRSGGCASDSRAGASAGGGRAEPRGRRPDAPGRRCPGPSQDDRADRGSGVRTSRPRQCGARRLGAALTVRRRASSISPRRRSSSSSKTELTSKRQITRSGSACSNGAASHSPGSARLVRGRHPQRGVALLQAELLVPGGDLVRPRTRRRARPAPHARCCLPTPRRRSSLVGRVRIEVGDALRLCEQPLRLDDACSPGGSARSARSAPRDPCRRAARRRPGSRRG